MAAPPKKLLDQVREAIRIKHYSYRTEESYVYWIRRFILFHDKRHPRDMGRVEIEAFLSHLAMQEQVAASTQNQAISALLFLYRYVLNQPFEEPLDALRAKRSRYLPTVLTKAEVLAVIEQLSGVYRPSRCSMAVGCERSNSTVPCGHGLRTLGVSDRRSICRSKHCSFETSATAGISRLLCTTKHVKHSAIPPNGAFVKNTKSKNLTQQSFQPFSMAIFETSDPMD